jgi:hypothetical protein
MAVRAVGVFIVRRYHTGIKDNRATHHNGKLVKYGADPCENNQAGREVY